MHGSKHTPSMTSRALRPTKGSSSYEIAIDSGAGTEAVGSTKTEMTKRMTARNPSEAPVGCANEPRPLPRFSSILTILTTMVNKMVRIWVEKNRKVGRMKFREAETVELKAIAQDDR